jgi:hypothetical protein
LHEDTSHGIPDTVESFETFETFAFIYPTKTPHAQIFNGFFEALKALPGEGVRRDPDFHSYSGPEYGREIHNFSADMKGASRTPPLFRNSDEARTAIIEKALSAAHACRQSTGALGFIRIDILRATPAHRNPIHAAFEQLAELHHAMEEAKDLRSAIGKEPGNEPLAQRHSL